ISDPLIKVIPPYRHREQSSSCSSTTSGGGQQFSPHFSTAFNGNLSNSDGFINRRLSLNASPLNSGLYTNSQLNSVASLPTASAQRSTTASSVSVSDGSGLRDGGNMLVDPLHRTALPQTSVDRAMMSAMMSQPVVGQTVLDGTCGSPISSGRSSAVQDSSPPVASNLSALKIDQTANADMHVTSAAVVPLPSNMNAVLSGTAPKDDLKPLLGDSALNNENISALASSQSSVSPVYNSVDGKTASSVQRAVKRPRTSQTTDKAKKPRNNIRANKSMKTLLESVGPLVSETVTDFQRERVNERDAAAAAAASTSTTHTETPSTSGENASNCIRSPDNFQAGSCGLIGASVKVSSVESTSAPANAAAACLPSTSAASTDVTKLCGAPLLRTVPKGLSSPEVTQASSSVDRHHVSTSAPSTSLGLGGVGGIQHGPLPQTLEELLERQWEQGSHFMMAHAPFDVAQLLSCLHELKKENVRLEGELNGLVRRRDHLLAVNAQLSLRLGQGSTASTNSPNNSPRVNGTATAAAALTASQLPVSSIPPSASALPSPANVAALALFTNSPSTAPASARVVGTPNSQHTASTAYAPPVDDSLNKLRTLTASSGLPVVSRNTATVSTAQLPTASVAAVVGRPASRQTSANVQQQAAISASLPQSSLAGFSQNRIPSTASANSIAPHASTPSSLSGSYTVTTPKSSMVTANDMVVASSTAATISPERQLAAAVAALSNPLNGNFLAPRAPNPLNTPGVTATATNNPLGQFPSQEILAQYALLHHQLMQQQAAATAAALRYGGIVMSGSSTPPTSSANTQATTGHAAGK
ncbi:unnamed protein product, partial [Enterobius vermicularis]|uniref:AF4/FMR2 family member lilli n=1 Tax=Enterobius vermicularis TaxID=51028 RepID=A0A0N4VNM0_ENTVE